VFDIFAPARRRGSLHDQLFKELIAAFLPDFVTLVAPGPSLHLDLSRWTLLDKETFTDWPKGRRRELDLLAEVALADGSGRTALVHIEIEARFRPEISPRLAGYAMQLRLRHGRPVLPLLLCLRRGRAGISLEEAVVSELGLEIWRFRYYSLGLEKCPAEDFLARDQPLAWALAALMRPATLSRAEHKMACLRRIASASLNDLPRFLLVNCVETYLELEGRDAEELEALQARGSAEEMRAMRAVRMTWAEQLEAKGIEKGIVQGLERGLEQGLERGLEQGLKKGMEKGMQLVRQTLLRQLKLRFGPLPDAVKQQVQAISSTARLNQIADQILVARSLEEMGLR
jgi:hypothetical protein